MMHISCDGCGKDLCDNLADHFVVKIETYVKHHDVTNTDEALADHLDEMNDLLKGLEGEDPEPPPAYKKMRYDLCPNCQKKFLADPLGRDMQKFDFSEN